jgi:hypothetical protein
MSTWNATTALLSFPRGSVVPPPISVMCDNVPAAAGLKLVHHSVVCRQVVVYISWKKGRKLHFLLRLCFTRTLLHIFFRSVATGFNYFHAPLHRRETIKILNSVWPKVIMAVIAEPFLCKVTRNKT